MLIWQMILGVLVSVAFLVCLGLLFYKIIKLFEDLDKTPMERWQERYDKGSSRAE